MENHGLCPPKKNIKTSGDRAKAESPAATNPSEKLIKKHKLHDDHHLLHHSIHLVSTSAMSKDGDVEHSTSRHWLPQTAKVSSRNHGRD
jgi:hypothetical protein